VDAFIAVSQFRGSMAQFLGKPTDHVVPLGMN
jgi:hypothetical protein